MVSDPKWGITMASASDGLGDDPGDSAGSRPVRRRRWPRIRPTSKSAKSAPDPPWSWSLGVSDWPIGKTDYDLTADQAVSAVLGLDKYFEPAMTGLSNVKDDENGSQAGGTQRG